MLSPAGVRTFCKIKIKNINKCQVQHFMKAIRILEHIGIKKCCLYAKLLYSILYGNIGYSVTLFQHYL